jgi:hypothetical protein
MDAAHCIPEPLWHAPFACAPQCSRPQTYNEWGHFEPRGTDGHVTCSTHHACVVGPSEIQATMAACWHYPAKLQALIESFTACCGHQHSSRGFDLVLSAAIILISGLSHPCGLVHAGCAYLVRHVLHHVRISLLPVLIWRLQQPIGDGKALLFYDTPCTRGSVTKSPAGLGKSRPPAEDSAAAESLGRKHAVPHVDTVREMMDALPPPCEVLCVPLAVLKVHRSAWRSPEVLGMVLETLERVRCASCARLIAHLNRSKPIPHETPPAAGSSGQGTGTLSEGSVSVGMQGLGTPGASPGCRAPDIGMAFCS